MREIGRAWRAPRTCRAAFERPFFVGGPVDKVIHCFDTPARTGVSMLKDLRIKTKLATGFGLIVAIILVLLTIAYINFSKLSMANQWDRHTLEVLLEVNHIENALLQVQTSTRGFMLTGEESVATPVAAQEAAAYQHLQQVRRLTGDNASQQERLSRLEPMMRDWIDHVIEPLLIKRRLANQTVGTSMQVATMGDIVNGTKTMPTCAA